MTGTLSFKLGQTVMWNIASERADKKLDQKLNEHDAGQRSRIYNTEIHEGVTNLESIR